MPGGIDFDREDPLNAGVLSDEQAATETAGVMCRYIRYRCLPSGTTDAFITNQMKIRPGVLAWLYLRRWDIEKTYDTIKNKLAERKAWGGSSTAKTMQAPFLWLGHNLMVLLENITQKRFGVENSKEITRAQKRIKQSREACANKGQPCSPLDENPRKRTQLTLKFIRYGIISASIACSTTPWSRLNTSTRSFEKLYVDTHPLNDKIFYLIIISAKNMRTYTYRSRPL